VIAYRAMVDVPRELVMYVSRLLATERRVRGTRKKARALTCFRQALKRGAVGAVAVTNPGTRTTPAGHPASLQITATDSAGRALTYQATGLPRGLSINSSTGLISGTATAIGSYAVAVTVTIANTGTTDVTGWEVDWDMPDSQDVGSYWDSIVNTAPNGSFTRTLVSARNREYNGTVKAGASVTFGFVGRIFRPVRVPHAAGGLVDAVAPLDLGRWP
jgi:hypothetical protein